MVFKMKAQKLFNIHIARSNSFNVYSSGQVAFVTNGFTNNGIQGYVKPLKGDRVFNFEGICISAFCEATVQYPPFMGRGNGGSGVIILEPIERMTADELLFYASYFNAYVRWRFSYGRMVTKDRISNLDFPKPIKDIEIPELKSVMPKCRKFKPKIIKLKYRLFPITELFDLKSGDYHNASGLPHGNTPLVSCGDINNGIMRFVKVPRAKTYQNTLTIAYNGQPLTTKYHPYLFAAKDDVAVCLPKKKFDTTTLLFIQLVINSEKWRFSYGRKCFREKLSNMSIKLPKDKGNGINEKDIKEIIKNTSYWDFLKDIFINGITLSRDITG